MLLNIVIQLHIYITDEEFLLTHFPDPNSYLYWSSDSEGQYAWADPLHVGTSERGDTLTTATRQVWPMQNIMQRFIGRERVHSHTGSNEPSWSWWPFPHRITQMPLPVNDHAQHSYQSVRQGAAVSFQMRAMVHTVREVLPNTPEEIILQVCSDPRV